MSAYMGRELELFVKSMGCGALLVLLYDGIRILRIIGKRMKYLDAAVDLLFWSAAGLFLFFTCLRENEGRNAGVPALRNFAGSRCLVLGNRAFLQRICIYFGKKVAFLFTKSYNFFTCKNAQILVKNA